MGVHLGAFIILTSVFISRRRALIYILKPEFKDISLHINYHIYLHYVFTSSI